MNNGNDDQPSVLHAYYRLLVTLVASLILLNYRSFIVFCIRYHSILRIILVHTLHDVQHHN